MALYLEEEMTLLENTTRAYLYRWTHIPSGKWYVGSRTSVGAHPEDGYYCSSKEVKPMILSNPQEWSREVLAVGSPLYIRELENKFLSSVGAAKDPMSFNKTNADGKFHRTGVTVSDETKDKLRAAFTGSTHSDETRAHFSKIRQGEGNPFYGKHHSDDTKQKLSKAATGYTHTDSAKKKITAAQTGKARSASAKSAISAGISSLAKKKCSHCGGEFSPALFGRWHGDNCTKKDTK
jgi:hypothetical protein